jgi:hypothetical protein
MYCCQSIFLIGNQSVYFCREYPSLQSLCNRIGYIRQPRRSKRPLIGQSPVHPRGQWTFESSYIKRPWSGYHSPVGIKNMHIIAALAVLLAYVSFSEASLYPCVLAGDLSGAAPLVCKWTTLSEFMKNLSRVMSLHAFSHAFSKTSMSIMLTLTRQELSEGYEARG